VATAVGLENLRIIEERDLIGNAARMGARMQEGLRRLGDHPLVGEVRGAGLIAGLELVADKATKRPFDPVGKAGLMAFEIGHEEGLIIRNVGDTLALCPPMIVTEDDIDEIVGKMGRILERTADWVAQEGLA
jgi:4-aminobutyrate--pyruvate transaminase